MTKVVLNPKHFHIRAKAQDGSIWLTHEKYRQTVIPIKDVTNDVLLSLCADLSGNEDQGSLTEREIIFSDGWRCRVTVEMVKDADPVTPVDM